MGKQQAARWLLDHIADFLEAAWDGDRVKLSILIAIPVVGLSWFRYEAERRRRRAIKYGLPLDGSVPEDDWRPLPPDEVMRIVNKRSDAKPPAAGP